MSNEPTDLTAFEQGLAEVPPNQGSFQRDTLLFAAGLAAGRRGRLWPVATAALALVSVGLGATLLLRSPSVVEVERVVYVEKDLAPTPQPPAPEPPSPQQERPPLAAAPLPPEWFEGLRLRESAIRGVFSSTPSAVWAAPASPSPNDVPDMSALRLNAPPLPGEPIP